MPKFNYAFDPPHLDPLSGVKSTSLSVRRIEDAGLKEILQTPGAAFGAFNLLDALLDPGNSHFVFREPLGQSREIKTALSGLFGRFVARAYAEKVLKYSHFRTLQRPLPMVLSGSVGATVHGEATGDLPDWVAWNTRRGSLAIIEAKGSNDAAGVGATLSRAYTQAERAWIKIGSNDAPFKRFAIATRWGVASPSPTEPLLRVKDPDSDGTASPKEMSAVGLGIIRSHHASLMGGLGFEELAGALAKLAIIDDKNAIEARRRALSALEVVPRVAVIAEADYQVPSGALIGGDVLRTGPLSPHTRLSAEDRELLQRLHLRPAFVGVDVETLKAAIIGDMRILTERVPTESILVDDAAPTLDDAGIWVVRPDRDGSRLVE